LSIDECATWEDHRIPTEIEFNNSGGADSDQAAFTVLRVRGDTWLVGGWSGLWRSLNNGVDWESITVIPADFTRGIAFSQNFPSDQTVYIGAYAAGIQITNDGGLSFTSPNWGIGQTNVQRIRTTKGDPNRISSIAAHFAYLSDDAGQNWRQLDDPFSMDRHVFSYVEPKELWVYGKKPEDGFDGLIAYSLDDGDTFSELTALNALMPSDPEYILRYHNKLNTLTYMATGIDGIFTADGPEGPWTKIGTLLGGSGGGAPVVWPEEAPERAMVAKGGSVHMSFDGGLTWKTSHLLDSLASISSTLFASDGTAFAVTETGRLFRSDTGEVWTEMITDVPYMHEHRSIIPAQVYEAQARPDFHKFREILLGTHDGVYVVTDSEPPTISRWSGWQVVDNKADFVYCNGCPEGLSEPNNEPYPGADFSAISRIREGIEMGVQLRGHTITLSGVILEESQVDVYVDGTLIESIGQDISLDPDTMETLITIEDLDDGWHHLTVEGIAGEGVLIDTFSSLTEASPLQVFEEPTETAETGHTGKSTTQTGTTDTSDSGPTETDSPPDDGSACGCASTTTQFLWLSLLTPLLILRRCKI
jgi:photosystem II stability/assembly factor-like uncharacterized protein